jgi:hypothetical protein
VKGAAGKGVVRRAHSILIALVPRAPISADYIEEQCGDRSDIPMGSIFFGAKTTIDG